MSEVLRVLQVVGSMNRGGAETMLMNFYRNIDRTKVQFDFVENSLDESDFDKEIESLGGKIYRCPHLNKNNIVLYSKWWVKFFKEHKEYTIVHGHIGSSASIYLGIAKLFGHRTIAHSHNVNRRVTKEGKMYAKIAYPTRYIADYLFSCSEKAGISRFGRKFNLAKPNCKVINNSVDTDKFAFSSEICNQMKKELDLEGKFVVGHVGRIQYQKNVLFLLDIFKNISERDSSAVLVSCGKGNMQEKFEKRIEELGLENKVKLLGLRSDVEKVCQSFDCFLFPSLFEGLPVTLVEMQAAGIPCVISDVITDEVCITDSVKKISLDESAEQWAEAVLNYKDFTKSDTSFQIKQSGFDVKITSKWLENFYLNVK